MAFDPKTSLEAGTELYKILKETGLLDEVLKFIRLRRVTDILILGASGTGKSTFIKEIFGVDGTISRLTRTTQVEKTEGKVDGKIFNLIDTPGQFTEEYKDERSRAIGEAAASRRLGIINVVSYGYHEGILQKSEAIDGETARPEYLDNRRKEEINQLSEWVNIIGGKGGSAQWIINLVTKADLWWGPGEEEDQISLKSYIEGDFFQALKSAKTNKYRVMPYCGEHKKFYGEVPMSGHYVDDLEDKHHNELIAAILALSAAMEDRK